MVVIRRTWVLLVLLVVIAASCTDQDQTDQGQATPIQGRGIPVRSSFTLPEQMRGPGALLEEAGIEIVYGPNSVPPPEGISDAAKAAWVNLFQVPFYPQDPERTAAFRRLEKGSPTLPWDHISMLRPAQPSDE